VSEDQTALERDFTQLFHRLPLEATPLGFRDAVMGRIATSRARGSRWEWVLAAIIAVPNLLFLLWNAVDAGDDLLAAIGGVTNALLGLEDWDASASVYVDGFLLLAIAFVGLSALLATHALLAEDRSRPRRVAA
jgi:hypothetical protein